MVLKLACGGGEWRAIQVMFTPEERLDRIVFSSEIAGSKTPKRMLIVGGDASWLQLKYVSPLLFSVQVSLGGGFHYKGMLRSKGAQWLPVPVGELGMSGIRCLLLKNMRPNLDSLLQSDNQSKLAMQELDQLLSQANAPMTSSEYVEQLSRGMAELMAPMTDGGVGTVPLAQRRRYP